MSKKLLTKLLAIVMSVGLLIQPVAAFAVEPIEGGAVANVEIVSSVDVTSNIYEVLTLGKELQIPSLTTTNENVFFSSGIGTN